MTEVSVVIPVYRGEPCLEELHRRLVATLEAITSDFEVVFVEDGGEDGSWARIVAFAASDKRVKGLRFSRNFGQHHSIAAGLDHCDGERVVIMDCDLQDPPEMIPRLMAKAEEGYDVVLARRSQRSESHVRRMMGWAFAKVFQRLTGRRYDHRVGAFRILSRRVVLAYRQFSEKTRLLGGAVDWLGFPTAAVDVPQSARYAGDSSYSFRRLIGLAFDGIIAYSDKPLRMSINVGLTISLTALLGGVGLVVYVLGGGHPVPGWTSVIVSIYFIGGLILANLGIVGAYIARIYEETKDRPQYIVADRVGEMADTRFYFPREPRSPSPGRDR